MRALEACIVTVVIFKYAITLSLHSDPSNAQKSQGKTSLSERAHELRIQSRELWKSVLLNQFHDVIPGSSIGMVYSDSDLMLSKVLREAKSRIDSLLLQLHKTFRESIASPLLDTLLFNPSPFSRQQQLPASHATITNLPFGMILYSKGASSSPSFGESMDIIYNEGISESAMSYTKKTVLKNSATEQQEVCLENELLIARFSTSGQLLSLLDRSNGNR